MSDRYTMGELAAQDAYGETRLRELAQEIEQTDRSRVELLYPGGMMSLAAGIEDVGRSPRPLSFKPASKAANDEQFGATLRGLTSQVDPERFHEAQLRWPESTNVVYAPDPTQLQRLRAWWARR